MNVKSRHHLRADAIADIEDAVSEQLGVEIDADSYEKVEFEDSDWDVVLVDGEPLVLYVEGEAGSASERSSAERSSADHSGGPRGGEAASNGTAEPSPSPREDGDAAEDEPFLTVEGANAYPPERNVVTVDAGAISFVSDGADVMRPGIVEADDSIAAGDLVAINEEGHGKFLAVGRAKTDGDDMVGDSGKVVESIHHVGDDLFEFSV